MDLWKRCPAFYLSLVVLVGTISAFFLPFLFLTLCFKKRCVWIIPPLMVCYVKLLCPYFPKEDVGKRQIHITEVKKVVGPFNTTLVYSGRLSCFHGEKREYRGLPVRLYLPLKQKAPPANQDYLIEGRLKKSSFGQYVLKPKARLEWTPIQDTTSNAQWRYDIKERVKQWVFSRFKEKNVQSLLSALATGNLTSPFLAYKFNAIGLQHLLAISGFHFALLAFCLTLILKRILPEKGMALSLIGLLTAYFFYMGGSPSMQRAWVAVFLHFVGLFFQWRSSPLNNLGAALLIALILDPLMLFNIGFQLSFGATLGILICYRPFERYLRVVFPKRPFKELLEMPRLDQCGYLFCAYLRSALALQASTLPFSLPLVLFHFKVFPLISLFYNLFFPLLFSLLLALFLFHLDCVVSPLASFLLMLVENAPKRLLFPISPLETIGLSVFVTCVVMLKKRRSLYSFIFLLLNRWKKRGWMWHRVKERPRRDSNTRPVA